MLLSQAGEERTPEGTKEEILEQIKKAFIPGGANALKEATAATGVSDSASRAIINTIAELGKELRKKVPGQASLPEEEVRKQLESKFEEVLKGNPIDTLINPLLGMPGKE